MLIKEVSAINASNDQCPAANSIFVSSLASSRASFKFRPHHCLCLQMLPFRRLAPVFKCLLSVSRPITSSVHRRAEFSSPEEQEQEPYDDEQERGDVLTERDTVGPASYRQFLEEIGHRYRFASPQKWLGNSVVEFVS